MGAGTVVDRDIVHPFEFSWFLNSHAGAPPPDVRSLSKTLQWPRAASLRARRGFDGRCSDRIACKTASPRCSAVRELRNKAGAARGGRLRA